MLNPLGASIQDLNYRPLLLPFEEVKAMKDSIGIDGIGELYICPIYTSSLGIPEQIISIRYILFKKDIPNNIDIPVRFDFKPILGSIESYYNRLKTSSLPNFVIPQNTPTPIPPNPKLFSLGQLFSFVNALNADGTFENENNYWAFFLKKNDDNSISLNAKILQNKVGGAGEGDIGGHSTPTGGPPPPKLNE
jgi:hypothetical protein